MSETYIEYLTIFLSWTAMLSGYEKAELPEVLFEQHSFFVENVCGGNECNVAGWYEDGGAVYIDERYSDIEQSFASSLVVHEFVHYLQYKSGKFDTQSCEDSRMREREAYYVQNRYIVEALARFDTIDPGPTVCKYKE
jgi:hypothetical protein